MKAFKLKYIDGSVEIAFAADSLTLIRERDLCTREHVDTRITQLSGEQEAIAFANASDEGI
jgi:hypothetical protein